MYWKTDSPFKVPKMEKNKLPAIGPSTMQLSIYLHVGNLKYWAETDNNSPAMKSATNKFLAFEFIHHGTAAQPHDLS